MEIELFEYPFPSSVMQLNTEPPMVYNQVLMSPKKEMATHSSILAWRIPWTEEPGGLLSMGLQEVGHDWSDAAAAAAAALMSLAVNRSDNTWADIATRKLIWQSTTTSIYPNDYLFFFFFLNVHVRKMVKCCFNKLVFYYYYQV